MIKKFDDFIKINESIANIADDGINYIIPYVLENKYVENRIFKDFIDVQDSYICIQVALDDIKIETKNGDRYISDALYIWLPMFEEKSPFWEVWVKNMDEPIESENLSRETLQLIEKRFKSKNRIEV